ncbi:MAG: HAMP domain-containing sensor histidine kinase [Phenylobacterium sp.]
MPPAAHQAPVTGSPSYADPPPRRETAFEAQKHSFLRMVSHELRTPLNSILGFSELLSSELYGPLGAPQYKDYAQIIRGSGQKLLKLVNQVLEIVRLEAGDVELHLRAEPIDAVFEDVTRALAEELGGRDIRVSFDGAGLQALADPRALRTIVGALLQNAVAFSPDGGEVRLRAVRNGAIVEILVEDDGEGVDPAELPRLLKPFEQGENALTRRTEGAGLGLPICDLTCQAMGGRLCLSSQPGQGFTASVHLRAA